MRDWKFGLLVVVGVWSGPNVDAGGKLFHRANGEQPYRMVTPNGSVVPVWATRRIENSTVPLFAPTYGRRPWANALNMANTPSGHWARASQLGYGAGPVPGFSNGPPLGNYPQAAVGPNSETVSPRQSSAWPFPLGLANGGY